MNNESSWCICGHHLNSHDGYRGLCYDADAVDPASDCDCTEFDPLWGDGDDETPTTTENDDD